MTGRDIAHSRQRIRTAYEDACRLEIEALKPGNVHLFADGHGMSADQFMVSARISSASLTDPALPVGRRILEAVRATQLAVGTNTNLGILLLSAPLIRAAEIAAGNARADLDAVLGGMTMDDTTAVFGAIALASPGGLGSAANDVREPPKVGLLEAMREAAGRDMIARQYVTGFSDVFDTGLVALEAALARGVNGMWPAVLAYMAFLAGFPDSHVARKHGGKIAAEVQAEAGAERQRLLACADEAGRMDQLSAFDRRLKARGINPGTSADLTVACLLVHLLGLRLA
jgi:triphosphoribosyl-dephospho-CoA synthase